MRPRNGFELIPTAARVIAALVFVAMVALMLFLFVVMAKANVGTVEGLGMIVFGLFGGAFLGAIVLLTGFVYGDAKQRGMPAAMWTLLVLLVPNLIGFVLYFLLRKPLLVGCSSCGNGIEPGSAFCPRCGARVVAAPAYAAPVQSGTVL